VTYPAGTPIPMTAFARKVLGGAAGAQRRRCRQQLLDRPALHERHRQGGGKVDMQISPALSLFGRYGWRNLSTDDQPPIPLPSGGGGNGNIYTRNKQLVLGTTYIASRIAARGPLRLVEHEGGKNPPALGAADNFGISGLPTDAASPAACRRRPSAATPRSAGRRPIPQWQFPTVFNPR
jgi:hypothetical protein